MNVAVGKNLLQLVYRHSIRTCIPGLLAFFFIGFFLSLNTTGKSWFYWMIVAGAIQLLRPVIFKAIIDLLTCSMNTKLTIACLTTFVYGASIGMSILFFPQLDFPDRLILTLVLVGVSGAASTVNAGFQPLYLSFAIPVMFPLAIFWALDPGDYLSTAVSLSIGALAIMKVYIMNMMGKHNFNTFSDYVELSGRQAMMSRELSDALERAEREQEFAVASNLSKTRFLAAASHDLRQPVHIVSLFGAALETMVKEDSAKEVIGDMNLAVRSLSKQLNELLDIAKLDSDFLKPDLTQLELGSVVNLVVNELQGEANAAGIELINSVGPGIYVYSDKTMLLQILRNVIGNAIKYTNQGSVALTSKDHKSIIKLSIVDTGVGMSEAEQKHIFEEFYQIDNRERNSDKGIGLGLSIVERLARSLSHEISILSKPGEGTCFSLYLKACERANVAGNKSGSIVSDKVVDEMFDCWVHIVDDEPSVRKSMGTLLEELGCLVTTTASTSETIEFMESNRPDVALVDLRLHGRDSGINTLNAIESIHPDIHRVMITGEKYRLFDESRLNESVIVLYKPVSKKQIVELLTQLLEGYVSDRRSRSIA